MISPVTARITTIFQLLCQEKRYWDDEITAEVGWVGVGKVLTRINGP